MPLTTKGLWFKPEYGSYVQCKYSLPDTFPEMTKYLSMMVWFKPLKIPQTSGLVVHYWYAWARLSIEGIPTYFRMPVWNTEGTVLHYVVPQTLEAGKEYCGAATYNYEGKARLWLFWDDGEAYNEGDAIGELSSTTTPLGFGQWVGTGKFSFYGQIWRFLAYNRELSEEEIRWNYENPTNPIRDGLVTWIDMSRGWGSKVVDHSGYGNHGKIVNARWIVEEQSGLWFNPSLLSYVQVPYIFDPSTTDWTLAILFKCEAKPTMVEQDMILFGQQGGTGTGRNWMYVNYVTGELTSYLGGVASGSDIYVYDGQWHLAVLRHTVASGSINWWVDGDYGVENTIAIEPANGNYIIGKHQNPTMAMYFRGMIKSVWLWKSFVDDNDLWQLYLNPDDPPAKENLVLWLPMTKRCGNIVIDRSGYGNHGKIVNAEWV